MLNEHHSPPSTILVYYSKPSRKRFVRFNETGFGFDKQIALNRKIPNRFQFGLANRLRPYFLSKKGFGLGLKIRLGSEVELQHNLWGGRKIWRAIASLEIFLMPPRPLHSRSHISGDQIVFLLQFQYIKTLANCNKASINNGWSSCHFRGPFTGAPLNPLKTDVSRGQPGLSDGPGPLGPHRNSTTG